MLLVWIGNLFFSYFFSALWIRGAINFVGSSQICPTISDNTIYDLVNAVNSLQSVLHVNILNQNENKGLRVVTMHKMLNYSCVHAHSAEEKSC